MLKQRVITAVAIIAILLLVLFALPPWTARALAAIIVLAGAWEWSRLLPERGPWRFALLAAIVLLLSAGWLWPPSPESARWLLGIAALWWALALVWIVMAPTLSTPLLGAIAGLLSLAPMWLAVVVLRGEDSAGARVLLLVLATIVAADTGAYFAGRAFGRIKLAPQVSPGKTWEGVLGGLALSGLVSWIGLRWLGWPPAAVLPMCLTGAAVSVVGDLVESKMKRAAGVKDSGHLFPGHGGVLDRIDSLSAGLPVLALGLGTLGLLP